MTVLNISLAIIFPQKAISWGGEIHIATGYDAYQVVLYKYFEENYPDANFYFSQVIKDSVLKPDRERANANHANISECAWRTKKLAKKCEKMLHENKNWVDILITMGEAAHFIQDINCPHHGIGRVISGHERFEPAAHHGYWAQKNSMVFIT